MERLINSAWQESHLLGWLVGHRGAVDQILVFSEVAAQGEYRSDSVIPRWEELTWKAFLLIWMLYRPKAKSLCGQIPRKRVDLRGRPGQPDVAFNPLQGISGQVASSRVAASFHPTTCPVTCSWPDRDRQSPPWWKITFLSLLNRITLCFLYVFLWSWPLG